MNKTVKRLILQYKEYQDVQKDIDKVKDLIIKQKLSNGNISRINYLNKKLLISVNLLNRISDEMTFKDPIVWILYKYYAYKGTVKDINNLNDLIQHCIPVDYVCTKRFKYLCGFVDISKYKPDINLKRFVNINDVKNLLKNVEFMEEWQKHEYWIDNGKIAKWKNFI